MKQALIVFSILLIAAGLCADWKVEEGFEDGVIPSNWTIIDGDDGSTWTAYENSSNAYNGSWMAFSESFSNGEDNWLILPQANIEAGDEFSAYIRSWYSTEEVEILVSVSGTSANDFDDELIYVEEQESDYALYNCDLSDYTGQDIYVGIHWICDTYSLLVDEVKLGQPEAGNTAPEINLPNEISMNENEILYVDFSEYVTDAEGDQLTLSVSDNDEVSVTIEELLVTFTPQADWFGEDIMMFYVSDGEFTDSDFLTVVVNEVGGNAPPEIELPGEFTFEENSSLTVDFSNYVMDPDGDVLTISYSDNNEVNIEIIGMIVTFTAEQDWFGEDIMMFYVSDGEFTDSDFLTIVVTEVQGGENNPPEINLPDSFSFEENGSLTVDFSEYAIDIDDDELTLSVSDNNEVLVEITGMEVTFTAEVNWFGEDVMMFYVSDGEFEDSDFVTIIVTEAAAPGWQIDEDFEAGVIPEDWIIIDGDDGSTWTAYENADYANSGSWMAFSESYDSEEDNWLILPQVTINAGDELSFFARSWYSTEIFEVMLSVEDPTANDFDYQLLSIEEQPSFYMQYDVDLTEYAGQQVFVGFHWTNDSYALLLDDIKLGQEPGGNTAPQINLPESITMEEDSSYTLELSEYIYDEEGDELTLTFSGNVNIAVAIDGMTAVFTPEPDWFGEETITFTVSDGEFSASDDILVIVTDVADHIYGDVDDNGSVESFDASLILQYVVGMDPAPYAPLPWEDWLLIFADTDGNGEVNAYDAALVLQYVVGVITEFPAESGARYAYEASVTAKLNGDLLSFYASGDLYSFFVDIANNIDIEKYNDSAILAHNKSMIAMASAEKLEGCFLEVNISDKKTLNNVLNIEVNGKQTAILLENNDLPAVTELNGNFPNPFNPSTMISFSIAEEEGTLSIYNLKGELLIEKQFLSGDHNYNWNAENYSSGKYYYRLKTNNKNLYGQMTLLK